MDFKRIKIDFSKRKKIHYSLLMLIFLLQLVILVTWYFENKNEKELIFYKEKSQLINNAYNATIDFKLSFTDSQGLLQKYLSNKNENTFNDYKKSIVVVNDKISDVLNYSNKINILNSSKYLSSNVQDLKLKLDSISNLTSNVENNLNDLKFEIYNANSVLNSIEVETNTEKDTLKKKGFFGRIGSAISGKSDVQKEKTSIIIKMKYGNKVISGDIKEQFKNILNQSNNFYKSKILAFKKNVENVNESNKNILILNNKIQNIANSIVKENKIYVDELIASNNNNLKISESKNATTRNFLIISLLIFEIVMTIIILLFTNMAFQYERRLIKAKSKINDSLRFKNRIVAMLSHEIRSPLSTISIVSRNVAKKIEDTQIKEQIKSIEFTTNSLMLMSNQILQYSKSENAKLLLNKVSFNLFNELDNIFKSLIPIVESHNNNLIVKYNTIDQSTDVISDLVKVHQLFYNLIGNANKFTEKGSILVNLSITKINNELLNLNVDINDSGQGISKTELENVFNDFYQGQNNEKVKEIGAGLGLNLCKEIVELLNGNIEVDSIINKGTKVSFNIILNKAP